MISQRRGSHPNFLRATCRWKALHKYLKGSALPTQIPLESLQVLRVCFFLSDIEAERRATEMLRQYTHFRLYFEKVGVPRRMKTMFGSIEGPVKKRNTQRKPR